MKYIKFLGKLSGHDSNIAGGKGASLGEMFNTGISVPNGFVVLSNAFNQFLEQTDLVQEIDSILGSVNHNAIHTVDAASEKIRELILSRKMPEEIKNEIISSFDTLDAKFVAVRSSATAEDGMDHAWAGQLESYLNVTKDDVFTKVQHCWSSLFTPRAIFYRFEKGLHATKISVAVVVQKMVNSEKSGIAFSVHPVTEDHNQIIIEAGYGLGEAIVSGSVTPDSYVVEKKPRVIIDININNQKKALYRKLDGGNEWIDLDQKKASSQVLSKKEILELSNIILTIENHYGFPCDIEWALEDGQFYITQSRPITTLTDKEVNDAKYKIKKSHWNLKKVFAREYSVQYCEGSLRSLGHEVAEHIPELYLSQCYLPENGNEAACFNENEWKHFQIHLKNIANDKTSTRKFLSLFHEYGREYIDTAARASNGHLGEQNNEELISRYQLYIHSLNVYTCYLWKGFYLNEIISKQGFELLSQKQIKSDERDNIIASLFSPIKKEGVLLLQEDLSELKRLGRATLSDEDLHRLAHEYAWLSCLDVHNDPWSRNQISLYYKELVPVVPNTMSYEVAVHSASLSEKERKLFDTVREFVFVKDMRDVYRRKAVCAILPLFDEIARRLNFKRSDLAYFSNEEIVTALRGELKVCDIPYQERKHGFLICWKGKQITLSTDQHVIATFYAQLKKDNDTHGKITGEVASRGSVSGTAKIIRGIEDLKKVQKGDILIAITTHPDFISAMQRATAFVTDEGGLTSHAAIIAREMNKPCIVGTKVATQMFKDGDMVRVNGDSGIIEFI